jgi:hypothetical protein
MKKSRPWFVFSPLLFLLIFPQSTKAQNQDNEIILPAGTLLRCTLNEPNFSSKTADVGDPVVCPLGGTMLFDRELFPRGAYLGGHLEADKDPGHFVGKGYLKLEFDHIGLPDAQVPVPAKLIAASNYKVDKEGKIVGHGHAKRDAAEWALPPLWPIKVLTLPNRGPRPTLKGEEQLSLRLMDDVAVPAEAMAGWHNFTEPSSGDLPRRNEVMPNRYLAPRATAPAAPAVANNAQKPAAAEPGSSTSLAAAPAAANVLVLRNGATYATTSMHMNGEQLSYTLGNGSSGAVSLNDIDWAKTFQSNAENGATLAVDSENAGR